MLIPGRVALVRTGIAIEFTPAHGAIIKDRSSMAVKGIRTSAGVIDAGYRGEIRVPLTLDVNAPPSSDGQAVEGYRINAGDKIAQMIPVKPLTMFQVEECEVLSEANRGGKGFGSTGK
jgi:deoxyuridine 5'-triphosphate nucleotidohydrolase